MSVRLWIGLLLLFASMGAIGCHHAAKGGYNLPPAERLMEPGPGVGGPGPGVLMPPPLAQVGFDAPCFDGGFGGMGGPMAGAGSVQVMFARPEGMQVRWDVGGVGSYDSEPLISPGRQQFPQGGVYRLKLTNIPGREGVELYPSIEIGRATPRTEAFFDHAALPIQFTEEDFDQVLSGNFVTKVIYLPDPEFQELAQAGVDTLVSTRLDPGLDPIVEADRRGSILAIIRLGNKDQEMPGGVAASMVGGEFLPAGYHGPAGCPPGHPGFVHQPPYTLPHPYVAGVTTPQYGMTMSGTPIGIPGPPHIPLGVPAGLQRHVINNRTHMHLPEPSPQMTINVKQTPGMSYPRPVDKVNIHEQAIHGTTTFRQPHGMKYQETPGGFGGDAYCPPQ